MVKAFAGTAKTTSIVVGAAGVKSPALALAFNRKIASELKDKLPGNWRTMTLNGLGQLAWLRSLPAQVSLQVDDRKLGKLVTQTAKQSRVDLSSEQWFQVRSLVSKAQQAGLMPAGVSAEAALAPDSPEVWADLSFEVGIIGSETDQQLLVDLARQVLLDDIALAKQGILSFDDQIYCPTVLGGAWPKFPAAAVDEAQDLSPLNQAMIRLATRPGAQLTVVGDPRQAIYAWRGADSKSMTSLRNLAPAWQDRNLTMSFRCPKLIVARQQHHAPGFRAFSTNREGRFQQAATSIDGGWSFQSVRQFGEGTFCVLCRNNAPLLSLAFKLIRQQIAPVMLGREIGKGLSALVKKLGKEEERVGILLGRLEEWEISERSKLLLVGQEPPQGKLDSISDRAESIKAVAEGCQARTVGDLLAGLGLLFSKESGAVTLSTIHKAKGLEWDLVVHLDPWRIPSRWARKAARDGDETVLEQEWNLKYVAETRTKNVLVNANLEDFV
jgi:hypothetical protein